MKLINFQLHIIYIIKLYKLYIMDIEYKEKYLKYKIKYLELQDFIKQNGSGKKQPFILNKLTQEIPETLTDDEQMTKLLIVAGFTDADCRSSLHSYITNLKDWEYKVRQLLIHKKCTPQEICSEMKKIIKDSKENKVNTALIERTSDGDNYDDYDIAVANDVNTKANELVTEIATSYDILKKVLSSSQFQEYIKIDKSRHGILRGTENTGNLSVFIKLVTTKLDLNAAYKIAIISNGDINKENELLNYYNKTKYIPNTYAEILSAKSSNDQSTSNYTLRPGQPTNPNRGTYKDPEYRNQQTTNFNRLHGNWKK
jgi:hypothetical protein